MKKFFFRLLYVPDYEDFSLEVEDRKYQLTLGEVEDGIEKILMLLAKVPTDVKFGPVSFKMMPPAQIARLQDYLGMFWESFKRNK